MKSSGPWRTEWVPSFHALLSRIRTRPTGCLQSLKGERRAINVTAQALKTLAVATVHRHGGVDVDATDFGECARTGALHEAEWADELGGRAGRTSRADEPGGRAGRTSWADEPGGRAGRTSWADELGGLAARRRAEQLYVRSGRAVTRRQDRLVA
ncbi:MAG: hypothetical protein ACI9KE_002449 [Polyangiales bacterium]|jgi:hypothetical protein